MPDDKKDVPLEKSLERLEAIVAKLESGDVALEKAINLYEEGRRLGAECQKKLEGLEKRILLVREQADGSLIEEPFDEDEAEE